MHGVLKAGEERHGNVRGWQEGQQAKELLALWRRDAVSQQAIRLCVQIVIDCMAIQNLLSRHKRLFLQINHAPNYAAATNSCTPMRDIVLFIGFP